MKTIPPRAVVALSEESIKKHLKALLCDDSEEEERFQLISLREFSPISFTIADRRSAPPYLDKIERAYDDWCDNLILDQLLRMSNDGQVHFPNIDGVLRRTRDNVERLLEYPFRGGKIRDNIWNQEFVDVVNRVIAFSLTANPRKSTPTHFRFNHLARQLVPRVIRVIQDANPSLLKCAKLSLISGLSGLDLKGSASASSTLADQGIRMRPYFDLPVQRATEMYTEELTRRLDCPTPVFHWERLLKEIEANQAEVRIAWFVDDYIETFFDMLFIDMLLCAYPHLTVTLIPRRRTYGVDASWADVQMMLHFPLFHRLYLYTERGRLSVSRHGPSMGALNLRKLSNAVVDIVLGSTFVVVKGCRAHEMVQGGINKLTFTMQVVARESTESVTGYDARQTPLLLFCLTPGEYAFYGFKQRHLRVETFPGEKQVFLCTSTLRDHERRLAMTDPHELISEVHILESQATGEYALPVRKEIQLLEEKLRTR